MVKHVILADHGELAGKPGVTGLIVNAVQGDAAGTAEPVAWGDAPPVRAITELWTEPGTFEGLDGAAVYRVDPHVHKQRARGWPLGEPSPRIKNVFLVRRAATLDADGFGRGWLERHVPLALRHHVGMCTYVTDVVLSASEGAPGLDGIAQLHFETERDLVERMYDSEEGRQRIEADVVGFVDAAAGLRVEERVLVEPPSADAAGR